MTDSLRKFEIVTLADYIPATHFRTVMKDMRDSPLGITELPVIMQVSPDMGRRQNFYVSSSGNIYGFARLTPKIIEIHGVKNSIEGKGRIQTIYLNEWDDYFLFLMECENNDEVAYFVTKEEVQELIDNCMRTPEQREGYGSDIF